MRLKQQEAIKLSEYKKQFVESPDDTGVVTFTVSRRL